MACCSAVRTSLQECCRAHGCCAPRGKIAASLQCAAPASQPLHLTASASLHALHTPSVGRYIRAIGHYNQPSIGERMQGTYCVTCCFIPYSQGPKSSNHEMSDMAHICRCTRITDSCLGRLEHVHGRPSLPNPESVIRVLLAAAGREVCAGLALAQHLAAQATEVVATRPAPAAKFPGIAVTQYEHWRWHHRAAAIRWHALQTTAS